MLTKARGKRHISVITMTGPETSHPEKDTAITIQPILNHSKIISKDIKHDETGISDKRV